MSGCYPLLRLKDCHPIIPTFILDLFINRLIQAGLHKAMRARIRQLEAEIAASKEELARFEARYGMSLSRFEAQLLSQQDSLQIHEDYNDWFYWQSVLEEKQRLLADLHTLDLA